MATKTKPAPVAKKVEKAVKKTELKVAAKSAPKVNPRVKPKAVKPAPKRSLRDELLRLEGAYRIPIDKIGPDPDQPRKEFDSDALDRLSDSLEHYGQLQPIRVREVKGQDHFVILDGERRWRAAMAAGLTSLSCVIDDESVFPDTVFTRQVIANCSREDLKPLELAQSIKKLMADQGWNQKTVGEQIGISQSAVSKALALLELPPILQDKVIGGELSQSVARVLAKIEDPEKLEPVVDLAIMYRWTQSQAEARVRSMGGELEEEPVSERWEDRRIADDRELSDVAFQAAHSIGISTFGELDAFFAKGEGKATFGGCFLSLWLALHRAKGIEWDHQTLPPTKEYSGGITPAKKEAPKVEVVEGGSVELDLDEPIVFKRVERVPLEGDIILTKPFPERPLTPTTHPEAMPAVYYWQDDETGIEFTVERAKNWDPKEILEAVWRLRAKLEKSFLDHDARATA